MVADDDWTLKKILKVYLEDEAGAIDYWKGNNNNEYKANLWKELEAKSKGAEEENRKDFKEFKEKSFDYEALLAKCKTSEHGINAAKAKLHQSREAASNYSALTAAIEAANQEAVIATKDAAIANKDTQNATLQNEIRTLEEEKTELAGQKTALEGHVDVLESDLETVREEKDALENDLNNLRNTLLGLSQTNQS